MDKSEPNVNEGAEDHGLDHLTREELDQAQRDYDEQRQRIEVTPSTPQMLGRFTVVCMVFNRTIGSGIWTVPSKVLVGTGSVGGSLLIWTASGIIAMCGALCWLEMGLSIPFYRIKDRNGIERDVSAPRSGGEKNFLEYVFRKPEFLATCIYGIMFIILGNISGNAVAFGIYTAIAAGKDPTNPKNNYEKGLVIGLAILTLCVCSAVHVFTRRGGILLNNFLAIVKILILLVMAILGFVHAGGKLQAKGNFGNVTAADINNAADSNLNTHTSFESTGPDVASYVESFLFALFSCTGFEQPFYALSEFSRPRKVFPTYTLSAVAALIVVYSLVNVSYYCVIPREAYTGNTLVASIFFHYLFDSADSQTAYRVMAGLVAFSCFGNVIIITFTAARVKQEIAKQGILPYSLFFASGHTTPWAWLKSRIVSAPPSTSTAGLDGINLEDYIEKTPMAAFGLHWFSSVFLILITVWMQPEIQYTFLSAIYSYVLVNILGCLVSGSLLYLKLDSYFRGENGRNWTAKAGATGFIPRVSPVHCIIYFAANTFMIFASFAKPGKDSAYTASKLGYPWFVLPTVGLSCLLLGVGWWCGLKGIEWNRRRKLVVSRTPYIERVGEGEYVQKAELVEHEWIPDIKSDSDSERANSLGRTFSG
ncbi:hypothetical protein NA57DRAFT_76358 [Rhizodiscina lignyota]|uniref:Amino acid transporter n=1 Tax=Rhizodiscina lignyota TaxID=1504668 RepID=A0A9P4ICP1_9PEZI|nr:hypothetical protein NA57DRAFT_76358 [Rhizodiscina lignyota]